MLFLGRPVTGPVAGSLTTPSFFDGVRMTTAIQRLENLGYRVLDEGRQEDGRYCVLAKSCGHFVIAFADSRKEAWAAVCGMALNLTCGGLRLPRP